MFACIHGPPAPVSALHHLCAFSCAGAEDSRRISFCLLGSMLLIILQSEARDGWIL